MPGTESPGTGQLHLPHWGTATNSRMAKKITKFVVELKERPSFEGELNIRVTAEHDSQGNVTYALVCQKNPPLDDEMLVGHLSGISDRELEQIWTAICWQRELSSSEVGEITALLQHEVVSIFP